MLRRRLQDTEVLRCSFCRKSQDSVQRLISNPTDSPGRAYICDECIKVCASILEDDREASEIGGSKSASGEPHALLDQPLTSQLLAAVDDWIKKELLGADTAEEFAEVRALAIRWIRPMR